MKLCGCAFALIVMTAGSAVADPAYVRNAKSSVAGDRSIRRAGSADAAIHRGGPPLMAFNAQQPPPKQQDEFVPIEQLPPQDQLPAAPLLVAAYSFVVLGLFVYVVSVARRLGGVQRELERLEAELKRSGRT
jgi:CcmD family protein